MGLCLAASFWGPIQGRGHRKVTFSWSPGSLFEACGYRQRKRTSFPPGEKKKGRIRPHLGITAFSPGQAKWNISEQTLPGTNFKVGTKSSLSQTQGLRELLVLCAGSTRSPACQAERSCSAVPQRLSQVCEEGSLRLLGQWFASFRFIFYIVSPQQPHTL